MVDRRTFLTLLGGGALALPGMAGAQQASAVRVGWVAPESRPEALNPFLQALKELGWTEGGNLTIEPRYAHGDADRYPELAADLVRLKADVIVTDGSPATKGAQQATTTIPIVFVSGDPVARGFVANLSRPGGNLTGVAIITVDLNLKRIELLKQAVPSLARLAVLEDHTALRLVPQEMRLGDRWEAIETVARQLGIQLTPSRGVRKPDDLDGAFDLALNLRTAKTLGLTIPQPLLLRVDQVVQ